MEEIRVDAYAKELELSMIPDGTSKDIAEEIGVENLLKLSMLIGGGTFYFPKYDTLIRPVRDKKIREEYNGYNIEEIMRKYHVTAKWIQKISNES